MTKAKLLICSSKQGSPFGFALQENLEEDLEVTVWTQGILEMSKFNLEKFPLVLEEYNFGLLILTPDDVKVFYHDKNKAVRDNIFLFLGLFIGRFGKRRTFIVMPKGTDKPSTPFDSFGVNVAMFNPISSLNIALGPVGNKVRHIINKFQSGILTRLSPGIWLVKKEVFTEILLERLRDKNVKYIRIVTYTSEVDAGLLNQFHVSGKKDIEIYKRSILSELAEEQEYNLRVISEGCKELTWKKAKVSIDVSDRLENDPFPGSTVKQYLYEGPPARRMYLFDDNELIISFYEILNDAKDGPDSIYRGMGKGNALHIRSETPFTECLLEEANQYILRLQRFSRSWTEEKRVLFDRETWQGNGRRPCIKPKAVFLDLDGVVFDSLKHYVQAWQEAFAEENIIFPEKNVFLEEGRTGKETIRKFLSENNICRITEDIVDRILERKKEILSHLDSPKLQKGASELIKSISATHLPIFIVTGSSQIEHIEKLYNLFNGVIKRESVIAGSDTNFGKPHPEPYLLACNRAKIHPHEAIVIENAPLGIQSANTAGTFCIAVNTGPLPNKALLDSGARAVFDTCYTLADKWSYIMDSLKI